MLICRIERCDTTVYYLLQSTGGSLSLNLRVHILLFPILESILFQSKCSSCSSDYCQSVSRVQTDISALPAVLLLCSIRLDPCDYGVELPLTCPVLSAVYRQNLQGLLPASFTLHCTSPVSSGHPHRIATGSEPSTEPDRVLPGRQEAEESKTRLALLTAALRIFLDFLVIFSCQLVVVRHWRSA